MSTRANIIITDGNDQLWFYRHSDGYPDSVMPSLKTFMHHVKEGHIRGNVGQAAGWLIVLGLQEYTSSNRRLSEIVPHSDGNGMGWRVGAYEPTTGQHGDIDYLYTVDLRAKTIKSEAVLTA